MNPWITRGFAVLVATHLGAVAVGLCVSSLMTHRWPLAERSAWAELGASWTFAREGNVCRADMGPWVRSVVAHRESLAADDFAVEAAVALHLLGDGVGAAGAGNRRR